MARCEDYPCCGHEPGDCPDSSRRMKCVECGKRQVFFGDNRYRHRCIHFFLLRTYETLIIRILSGSRGSFEYFARILSIDPANPTA